MLEIACSKWPYISLLYCKFSHCHWKPHMPYCTALLAEQAPSLLPFPNFFLFPPIHLDQGLGIDCTLQCTPKSPSPSNANVLLGYFSPLEGPTETLFQKNPQTGQSLNVHSLTILVIFVLSKLILW